MRKAHVEAAVAAALENLLPGAVCLASVSGGADSVAMLVALAALKEQGQSFELRCIHVEHGIRARAESRGDAEFVRSLCSKLQVPCRVVSVKPGKVAETARKRGIGIEAAARLYRQRAWRREAEALEEAKLGPVRVLVAHTADDMLETVLMRILRGAGASGLAAMPASRGRILRPLLALGRQDVLRYLAEKEVPWREDSTNVDIRYLRNRVRHRLVPELARSFPKWRVALSSLAQTQTLAAEFIVSEANRRVEWRSVPGKPALCTDEAGFFAQPAIVREEALFQGIDALLAASGSELSRGVKRSTVRAFSQGNKSAADLGPVHLRLKNGIMVLSRHKKGRGGISGREYGFSLLIIAPGLYTLKGVDMEVSEALPGSEPDGAEFFALLPLVLRPSFKEDRIEKGGPGGGKAPNAAAFSAEDSRGVAAFIGRKGLLKSRSGVPRVAGESPRVVKVKVMAVPECRPIVTGV